MQQGEVGVDATSRVFRRVRVAVRGLRGIVMRVEGWEGKTAGHESVGNDRLELLKLAHGCFKLTQGCVVRVVGGGSLEGAAAAAVEIVVDSAVVERQLIVKATIVFW